MLEDIKKKDERKGDPLSRDKQSTEQDSVMA